MFIIIFNSKYKAGLIAYFAYKFAGGGSFLLLKHFSFLSPTNPFNLDKRYSIIREALEFEFFHHIWKLSVKLSSKTEFSYSILEEDQSLHISLDKKY